MVHCCCCGDCMEEWLVTAAVTARRSKRGGPLPQARCYSSPFWVEAHRGSLRVERVITAVATWWNSLAGLYCCPAERDPALLQRLPVRLNRRCCRCLVAGSVTMGHPRRHGGVARRCCCYCLAERPGAATVTLTLSMEVQRRCCQVDAVADAAAAAQRSGPSSLLLLLGGAPLVEDKFRSCPLTSHPLASLTLIIHPSCFGQRNGGSLCVT